MLDIPGCKSILSGHEHSLTIRFVIIDEVNCLRIPLDYGSFVLFIPSRYPNVAN
jgi:hypothetical protein